MSANETLRVKWARGERSFPAGSTIVIGRDSSCDIVVENPNVSRQHARVAAEDGDWVLVDAGSSQGVHQAGQPVSRVVLRGTTELVLGRPGAGERIELAVQGRSVLDGAATVLPDDASPADATVLPEPSAPQRPGGSLRAEALTGATVVTGGTLNVECGGRSYSFEPGRELVIGRDPASDIPTSNPTVSRRHAKLSHDGDHWVLEDLGSSGGTFVDGRRVSTMPLAGSVAAWLGDEETGERLVLVAPGQRTRSVAARIEHAARRGPIVAIVAGVAALAVVIALAAFLLGGGDGGGPNRDELVQATVAVIVDDGFGSGSIIDGERGLILTNAHVVAPRAPGMAVRQFTPAAAERENPEIIEIAVSPRLDEAAEVRYRGTVIAAEGYLDLAVVQITHTGSGSRIDEGELDLRALEIGSSEQVRSGDDVRIVGFPGNANSNSASIREGIVSGSQGDDRLETNRALFNLDATISGGNSGGALVDGSGELIGVPTSVDAETGQVGHAVPIDLARPLIDAVLSGEEYESAYAAAPTGNEQISAERAGWSTPGDLEGFRQGGCDSLSRAPVAGDEVLAFSFEYEGFVEGHQDVLVEVYWDGDLIGLVDTASRYPFEFDGSGCATVTVVPFEPLGRGRYNLKWYVGPTYRQIAVPLDAAEFRIGSSVSGI